MHNQHVVNYYSRREELEVNMKIKIGFRYTVDGDGRSTRQKLPRPVTEKVSRVYLNGNVQTTSGDVYRVSDRLYKGMLIALA
jgi:hypothetical protein